MPNQDKPDLPEWKRSGVKQWRYLVVLRRQGEETHKEIILPDSIENLVDNTLGGQFHVYRVVASACGWEYNPVRASLVFYNLTFSEAPKSITRVAFKKGR
jgi:hypothetical protein